MSTFLRNIRVVVRFVAAVLFWLHALFLFYIPAPPIRRWAASLNLNLSEAIVILLLAVLTALSSYGIRKFSVDIAYIYFFPFVALYHAGQLLVSILASARQTSRTQEKATAAVAAPGHVAVQGELGSEIPKRLAVGKRSSLSWSALIANASKPLRQFALLWCLLLLLSSKHALVWLALVVVLLQLSRALYRALTGAVFSLKWLSSIEDEIRTNTQGLLQKLMAVADDVGVDQALKDLVQRAVGVRTALQLLQNRRRVWVVVSIASICTVVVLHLYFSLFFSFAYYGVALVQSIEYSWGESLVNSVFIPFLVSTLPRNIWLKLLGGIQCTLIIAMSFGALFAYVQRKLDAVYDVTQELNARFEAAEVKAKLDRLQQRLTSAATSQVRFGA